MRQPVRKMIIAIVLAAVLLVPAFFLLRNASVTAVKEEIQKGNEAGAEAFSRLSEKLYTEKDKLEAAYLKEQLAKFQMEAMALSEYVSGDSYSGPETFENGFVLRVRNGKAVYPAGVNAGSVPLPEGWEQQDYGYWSIPAAEGNKTDFALQCKVAKDARAVKTIQGDDVREYVKTFLDAEALTDMQKEAGSEQENTDPAAYGSVVIVLNALVLIAAALITWHIAVQRLIRNRTITGEQHKRFQPGRVRRMAIICCAVSTAAVFLIALVYITLTSLRTESTAAANTLQKIETMNGMNDARNDALAEREQGAVLQLARDAAELMGSKPGLQTRENLRRLAETVECEYVMLFDPEGKEILSDRDYVGFTLSTKEEDETYPFRRLLQGVDTWIAEPAADEITGKELQKIGVRVPAEGTDRYGALILALKPDGLAKKNLLEDVNALLRTMTPEGAVCFAVDRETGTVVHASDPNMVGMPASAYGVTEALAANTGICGITGGGRNWYGASRVIGQEVWFNCAGTEVLGTGNRGFALLSGGLALVYFALLLAVLLWDYTQENYDESVRVVDEAVRRQTVEVMTADGRVKKTLDPTLRWGTIRYRWNNLDPGQKTQVVFQLALLIAVLIAVFLIGKSGRAESSMISFILSGNWARGINLFALAAAVMVCGMAVLVILILKLIVHFICLSLGAKGETILKLLFNLTQYILIFAAIYYSFIFFGIDTGTLLGAMAFISLAISLGSKDLVSDILAGLSIVFAGEFQVGDIVEIGGFRGKVMEIGARSTKLMSDGGNVKIISNRNIGDVLNMTRYNSWYAIELEISSKCPLEKMEAILKAELPAIGERSEMIINGPVYKGVTFIGKRWFRIMILAECKEKDYASVKLELNRELQLLLSREDFPREEKKRKVK